MVERTFLTFDSSVALFTVGLTCHVTGSITLTHNACESSATNRAGTGEVIRCARARSTKPTRKFGAQINS